MSLYTGDQAIAEQLPEAALWEMCQLRHQGFSDSQLYPILNTAFKLLLKRAGFKGWEKCWEQKKYDATLAASLAHFIEKLQSFAMAPEVRVQYLALLYGATKAGYTFEPAVLRQALEWDHPRVFVEAARHWLTSQGFQWRQPPDVSERIIGQFLQSVRKEKPDSETFTGRLALLLGASPPTGTFTQAFLLDALLAYPGMAANTAREMVKTQLGEAAAQSLAKLPSSSAMRAFVKELACQPYSDEEKIAYVCLLLGIAEFSPEDFLDFLRKALSFNHPIVRQHTLLALAKQANPLLSGSFQPSTASIAVLADAYGAFPKAELMEKLQAQQLSVTEALSDGVGYAIVSESLTAEQATHLREANIRPLVIDHVKAWLQQQEAPYLEKADPHMAGNLMRLLLSGQEGSAQLALELMRQGGIPVEIYDQVLALSCVSYYQYAPQLHQLIERFGQPIHATFFKKHRLPGNVESAVARLQNAPLVFDREALLGAALEVFGSNEGTLPGCSVALKEVWLRIIAAALKADESWAETALAHYAKQRPIDLTVLPQKELVLKTIQRMPLIEAIICNEAQLKKYVASWVTNPHLRQITVKLEGAAEWGEKTKLIAEDIERKTKIVVTKG